MATATGGLAYILSSVPIYMFSSYILYSFANKIDNKTIKYGDVLLNFYGENSQISAERILIKLFTAGAVHTKTVSELFGNISNEYFAEKFDILLGRDIFNGIPFYFVTIVISVAIAFATLAVLGYIFKIGDNEQKSFFEVMAVIAYLFISLFSYIFTYIFYANSFVFSPLLMSVIMNAVAMWAVFIAWAYITK